MRGTYGSELKWFACRSLGAAKNLHRQDTSNIEPGVQSAANDQARRTTTEASAPESLRIGLSFQAGETFIWLYSESKHQQHLERFLFIQNFLESIAPRWLAESEATTRKTRYTHRLILWREAYYQVLVSHPV